MQAINKAFFSSSMMPRRRSLPPQQLPLRAEPCSANSMLPSSNPMARPVMPQRPISAPSALLMGGGGQERADRRLQEGLQSAAHPVGRARSAFGPHDEQYIVWGGSPQHEARRVNTFYAAPRYRPGRRSTVRGSSTSRSIWSPGITALNTVAPLVERTRCQTSAGTMAIIPAPTVTD